MTVTSAAAEPCRGVGERLLGGHTDTVLTLATNAIRVAALVLIAAAMFVGPTVDGPARVAQLACFGVGTATVIIWAAMAWRRPPHAGRWLVVLFVFMAASSVASTTQHGGALISFALLAAVGAGASEGLLAACAVTAVGILAITISSIATGASSVSTLGDCLEVEVALLLGRSRRSTRVREKQSVLLLAQAEQLRAEQAQVATLRERARIAREIHDVLAHSLGALNVQIQAARALLSERGDADQALTVLGRAQRIAGDGLDETRRAVHALRTDSRPLDQELATLAETHETNHHVRVSVEVNGAVRTLAPEAAVALLRTAQESLVNAAKHSPGQPVTLTLTFDETSTHLQVTNPLGCRKHPSEQDAGFATVDGGYGLLGMRERLLLLHGTLTAQTHAGRWEVTALVPR
jgi:signal transduction histidine kinase